MDRLVLLYLSECYGVQYCSMIVERCCYLLNDLTGCRVKHVAEKIEPVQHLFISGSRNFYIIVIHRK